LLLFLFLLLFLLSGTLAKGHLMMRISETAREPVMTTPKKSAPKKSLAKKSAAKKTAAAPSTKSATATRDKASNAIDEQLARYRSMRDFKITDEPSGASKSAKSTALPFVIQKHAASHLHYDFRLGWNGVLKSWAISKGPSYVVKDKRLAVQVEDHPMEYGGFEGIIPKGQYGGGTVMLWDNGTWEPQPGHTDIDEGLRTGNLKFIMHGTKMRGKWALIRMGGKFASASKPNWLLIKEHDDYERSESDPPVTEAEPNSVVTGRSLEQIAASEDHVWHSKHTATDKPWQRIDEQPRASPDQNASSSQPNGALSKTLSFRPEQPKALSFRPEQPKKLSFRPERSGVEKPASLPKLSIPATAPKENLPEFIPPQLAQQSETPPASKGWLHELKLDGYRIQARKEGPRVQLLTRTGLDWTHRMKTIAAQVSTLPCQQAILDGEVVVLDEKGNTSFADLQAAFQEGPKKPLTYFIFDLLHLNGRNLRNLPLIERKEILATLLTNSGGYIRLSEHLASNGAEIFRKACELQAEGIISKRAEAKYISGRTTDWLKIKCVHEQEFVIGGFTLPGKGHTGIHGVGALLLGYYRDGKLIYAGRTGTGFTQKTHNIIRTQLEKIRQKENPFEKPPAEARTGAIWVKPYLVAQVQFATWTADNLVRQAAFKGLREDKPATEVRREAPVTIPKYTASKSASHTTAEPVAAKTLAPKSSKKKPLQPYPSKEVVISTEAQRSGETRFSTAKPTKSESTEHAPIRLTHPEKILDAESHLTKQQLAVYYWAIASHMLPFVANRPLSLVRCPEGTAHPCFFQKHVNNTLPPGIGSVDIADKNGKVEPYITLSTPETLTGLAQLGVLELHPWGSTNDDLEHPDRIIFDIDPDPTISWRTLADSALEIRHHLASLKLESFLKSTGGKGLHVVVPIKPEHDWPTIKQFAHTFVLAMEQQQPTLYLTKMTKAARKDRIYLDYLRNERGATAVAPFSPRSRPGVAVSMPLNWTELKHPTRPIFQVINFADWKDRLKKDPWQSLPKTHQRLNLKSSGN
jgi:bifunctional non-homologous end joining protein LigD